MEEVGVKDGMREFNDAIDEMMVCFNQYLYMCLYTPLFDILNLLFPP